MVVKTVEIKDKIKNKIKNVKSFFTNDLKQNFKLTKKECVCDEYRDIERKYKRERRDNNIKSLVCRVGAITAGSALITLYNNEVKITRMINESNAKIFGTGINEMINVSNLRLVGSALTGLFFAGVINRAKRSEDFLIEAQIRLDDFRIKKGLPSTIDRGKSLVMKQKTAMYQMEMNKPRG